jgi:precorrin isomerase
MAERYLRDGDAIYQRSFAIIRAEADLARFSEEEADVAVRMIHACGIVEAARAIEFGSGVVAAARAALAGGAPIFCDAEMVAHGVTRARLPARNDVICTLRDPRVVALAAKLGTTRSAAALDLWAEQLAGAVVAIGNAPRCGDRHAGRLRRRGRIERRARREPARAAVPDRARAHRRQRDGGGGGQCAGEARAVRSSL